MTAPISKMFCRINGMGSSLLWCDVALPSIADTRCTIQAAGCQKL